MLDFLGRSDQQVKIRGYRIEPGEIEAGLLREPGVTQGAVVVREDQPGRKQLVGYVVLGDRAAEPMILRERLAATLPDYMVPTVLVPIAGALPRTPNGKLDRNALPAPEIASGSGREPRIDEERRWCALFADALQLAVVGVEEDFVVLGGDSITAMTVVSRGRAAGFALSLRELFGLRTAAALAAVIPTAEPLPPADDGHSVELVSRDAAAQVAARLGCDPADVWPASPLQEGLFFQAAYDDGPDVYTAQHVFEFDTVIDVDRLRLACTVLMRRNPILRGGLTSEGLERPLQFLLEDPPVEIEEVDLARVPAVTLAERLAVLRREHRARRFDLAEPPLFRIIVAHLDGGCSRLVLTQHLAAWDGWSQLPFFEQLWRGAWSASDRLVSRISAVAGEPRPRRHPLRVAARTRRTGGADSGRRGGAGSRHDAPAAHGAGAVRRGRRRDPRRCPRARGDAEHRAERGVGRGAR